VKTSEFSFDLPDRLIAQQPPEERESARLLVLDRATGKTADSSVRDLPGWIEPGTVIVLNDTRVRKARVFAESAGGGRVEFLFLERRDDATWEVIVGRARRIRPGKAYSFPGGVTGTVVEVEPTGAGRALQGPTAPEGRETRLVRFEPAIDEAYLEHHGHVPLPPYIHRPDVPADQERYQTVFSRVTGSAAAPTAGLHFTPRLLAALNGRGVQVAYVTLHVGLGTFLPIRAENIEDHVMHEERFSVPSRTKALVDLANAEGRPVLAVGTTVVRTLESAWTVNGLREGEGSTRAYITPGYQFRVVNQLFTNFHTPGSSLLVLVSAFAGRELILRTYAEAVAREYRFFSYGDAMLIR
jgi:S-adenosylmethionine:tRNA ribosyltransferase-isomerase